MQKPKIHITILGKATLPIYYPIQTLNPDKVFLLGTSENVKEATRIKDFLESNGIKCETKNDIDAYKVTPTKDACEEIFKQIHEEDSEADVSVNITGATKPMSVAAYTVGMNHGAAVIYTNAQTILNMLDDSEEILITKVDTPTILSLCGQKMKNRTLYKSDEEKTKCSRNIMKFINYRYWDFRTLRDMYAHMSEQKKILRCYQHKDKQGNVKFDYSYDEENHAISINYWKWNNQFVHKDVYQLLFEGRWWETIVADAIAQWADGKYEVSQNVTFYPKDEKSKEKGNDKNEMDILVNIGNTFIIIECKSGSVDQNIIGKMKNVRDTYASIKSKSVLVSFYPLSQDLREKADDADIFIIEPLNGNMPYDNALYKNLPPKDKMQIVTKMIESIPQQLEAIKNAKKA